MELINQLLLFLLNLIFNFTKDWGLAIIILTLGIKILLLPLSLKQKAALEKQQDNFGQMEKLQIESKQGNQQAKKELERLTQENLKRLLGCVVPLLQLPVVCSLYSVFSKMPMEVSSILIPWLTSLKLSDPLFIIPTISLITQVLPNILVSAGFLKSVSISKLTIQNLIFSGSIIFIFMAKAPVTLGLYWIVSSLVSAIEQILYSLFKSRVVTD